MYTIFVGGEEVGELTYEQLCCAALLVRKKYNVPSHVTIQRKFEREYNCKLIYSCDDYGEENMDAIKFPDEAALTLFWMRI